MKALVKPNFPFLFDKAHKKSISKGRLPTFKHAEEDISSVFIYSH